MSTSLAYASSLAMVYLNPPLSDIIAPLSLDDIDDLPFVLPCSTCILYTDGFFLNSISEKSPSMSYAWLAFDDDNFILEFSLDAISSTYPSAYILKRLPSCQHLML